MDNYIKSKQKILNLIERRNEIDTFEISMSLKIPQNVVLEVINELEHEGTVQVLKTT